MLKTKDLLLLFIFILTKAKDLLERLLAFSFYDFRQFACKKYQPNLFWVGLMTEVSDSG